MLPDPNEPEPGFYAKYKRDPKGPRWKDLYYVEQIGYSMGRDVPQEKRRHVIYRPLDDTSYVYKNGKRFDLLPLEEFIERVEYQGRKVPRHSVVTDPELVREMRLRYEELYGRLPDY
jgi:hypothetical protein